ncbi:hypothetical protein F2P81_025304 [Scophthalmus maximus]|uniref:Uncharacterized protein n=1 Tax=Scophthalmus maximus TaxID=52904 RepID=A0A6A4RSU4_SCOMX|nr:hypothetical protein F2P81_025304 [Scophthalmus maximus]
MESLHSTMNTVDLNDFAVGLFRGKATPSSCFKRVLVSSLSVHYTAYRQLRSAQRHFLVLFGYIPFPVVTKLD